MRLLATLIVLVSLNVCSYSYALTFKVIGKNSEILFSQVVEVTLPQTVGEISVDFFNNNQIPFVGDIDGIVSVYDIASELELISDTDMKAHGWCYSVNGVIPEDFVHKVSVSKQETELVWFYGYAYYQAGEWISQCVPHGKENL